MVKKEKLVKRVLASPKNVRFANFVLVIEAFGFTLARISGSHHIFAHPDVPQTISVQPHENGKAKPYQIKQLKKLIDTYALKLVDNMDTTTSIDDEDDTSEETDG